MTSIKMLGTHKLLLRYVQYFRCHTWSMMLPQIYSIVVSFHITHQPWMQLKAGDKTEQVRFFHCYKRGVDRIFVDHPWFLEKVTSHLIRKFK